MEEQKAFELMDRCYEAAVKMFNKHGVYPQAEAVQKTAVSLFIKLSRGGN